MARLVIAGAMVAAAVAWWLAHSAPECCAPILDEYDYGAQTQPRV